MVKPISLVFCDLSFSALETDLAILETNSFSKVNELATQEEEKRKEKKRKEKKRKGKEKIHLAKSKGNKP